MDIEWLFSNPYVPYIVGVVALLFLYQRFSHRVKVRLPGRSFAIEDVVGILLGPGYARAKLQRTIARERKAGNYLLAGKLCEDANELQLAVEIYMEGQEYFAAGTVLEAMGKWEGSAEMFIKAGDWKKAAQVLVDKGQPLKAASLFYEKGNQLEAARFYSLGGAHHKAAELYARAGYPLRAAEAYEKKGDYLLAAEQYERHFMENVSYSTTYSSTAPSTDQKSALNAGRLYEKAGELTKALQAYSRGSYFKEAGAVCVALKQHAKAAELFMRAEDPESAADAYDHADDTVKAANLRGEIALKQERLAEAAAHFQEGEDYLRAAELFETVGMLAEAAGAYEAGESHAAAGSVYIRAGLKDKAAAAYEKAADLETAAKLYEEVGNERKAMQLYERAGLTFKSGEAAAKAGEREKAIALLQHVVPSDENYRAATELLAKLFIESRMPGLAVERVQRVLGGQPISPGTLDLYYWLGVAYEGSGNAKEAQGIYKKILAEDLQFRDVGKRVARLQSGVAPATAGEERAVATRRELHERGVATLQVCPSCGRCYDHTAEACAEDKALLSSPRVLPYTLLDRYRLIRVLGEGGMGIVFEAHDRKLDRNVAIKIVNAEEFTDQSMRVRLEREARAVAKIPHPGVVGIHDSGELQDGSAFLVMELLEGHDLGRLIRSAGRGRPSQVASLLRQAASALGAAHRAGIVHRDLKPQNIFLVNGDGGFRVKVLDFGVAKSTSAEVGVTQTGQIVGTPAYMSPEQIQGPKVDARSDIHSLAVVAWEALTAKRLFPEQELMKTLFAVTNTVPPPLSTAVPGVPAQVDEAFASALAKDPEKRPADVEPWVASFVDLLERVSTDAVGWAEPLPPVPERRVPLLAFPPPAPAGAPAAPPKFPTVVSSAPTLAQPATVAPAKGPRFVNKEELGSGPLGSVFRAVDQVDGRSVALRVLPPSVLQGDGVLQALVADLKGAAQLSHPNIVKILGFVEMGGQRCVISEFVSGRNFAEALRAGHKMTFQQVHGVGRVLAQALAFIHGKGLVHGSIQPSNIMVSQGVVKLADLGLARLYAQVRHEQDYTAPEGIVDAAGDLYALAAVLYHLLTGVNPKSQAQGAALPLPSTLAAGVPEAFDKLLLRCLHPRAELRFPSSEEILRELKDMVRFG